VTHILSFRIFCDKYSDEMTVNGEANHQTGVLNLTPLKKSASFTISVDKVEAKPKPGPAKSFTKDLNDVGEEWSGDEDDEVEEVIIPGTDWESVNYVYKKFGCEDEVTGLAVSERYIVAQYFMEPTIDVFDRKSLKRLHRLEGHEYGGQTVELLGQILYSGSKDCSLRTWDLRKGTCITRVEDHRDYIHSICVRESPEGSGVVVTGGAADHLVIIYDSDETGTLKCRHKLSGHSGWVTSMDLSFDCTRLVTGGRDSFVIIWDALDGQMLRKCIQDAEITCLSMYPLLSESKYVIFGDGESKLSLLNIDNAEEDETEAALHLMPNIQVGTGRFRRSHKYHDKNVDKVWVSDNGYMVTVSTGSKFVKIWKIEHTEGHLHKTDVTEIQILREHSDYLSIMGVHKDTIFSASGDQNIWIHRFPTGKQHYDMLRTQERNSVAVLYQGPKSGFAPSVEKPTVWCEGKLCKVGKCGLAKSSSSFQVNFNFKPLTKSLTEGTLVLPRTIEEDSENDSDCEFVIEYVTDSEED